MQHVQNVVLMSVHSSQNILEDYVLRVGMIARRQIMCVKTELQQQDTRIITLEKQHDSPEDMAALRSDIARINAYLFGAGSAPDVPRSKSGLKAV